MQHKGTGDVSHPEGPWTVAHASRSTRGCAATVYHPRALYQHPRAVYHPRAATAAATVQATPRLCLHHRGQLFTSSVSVLWQLSQAAL